MILHIDTKLRYKGERLNGMLYPPPVSMEKCWTTEELNAIGLAMVTVDRTAPEGKRTTGEPIFTLTDGVFFKTWALEDIPPPTEEELDERLERPLRRKAIKALFKSAFVQENRIRALEGKSDITVKQFRSWIKGEMQ